MFHVGQKVVCVDASPANDGARLNLSKSAVYTVSGHCLVLHTSPGPGILICETSAPIRTGYSCGCFRSERFRPVTEKKTETGMEVLRKLQNPANHKILERT